MSVIDKDRGMIQINKNFRQAREIHVAIGHFSDSGKTEDGELALAELMATHEFGSAKMNIPSRPVYRSTYDENIRKVRKLQVMLWSLVLAGKLSPYVAAARLGAYYEGLLKLQFTKKQFAKLSPNYKVRPSGKKVTPSSKPLIDTGNLRSSIKWKIF